MDWAIVLQDFFDGTTVAKPVELRAPKKFPVLVDAPATTTCLANEGMVELLTLCTATRTKPHWS